MKTLLIVYSFHHNNTQKIAEIIAKVLNAEIKNPKEITADIIHDYDLIGFGSGIYSETVDSNLLDLARRLPASNHNKGFIFSTAALTTEGKKRKDHQELRNILKSKEWEILEEFQCKGFNTNSFLKFFGGMNKKRPNEEDLNNAKNFAQSLKNLMEKKA